MEEKSLTTTVSNNAEVVQISAMNVNLDGVKEFLAENLGAGGMSVFDLPHIKVPAGGGVAYEVQDLDGNDDGKSRLQCVIMMTPPLVRTYWKTSIEDGGGNKPPDCHSDDSVIGIGNPGGPCAECPLSQFESATKGKGQACKQSAQAALFREGSGSVIPEIFSIPPSSLKPLQKYKMWLAGRGLKFGSVLTEIGLAKVKGESATYSQATFKAIRLLTEAEAARIAEMAALYRPLLDKAITAIPATQAGPGETKEAW